MTKYFEISAERISAPRVSLVKPEAPECVAFLLPVQHDRNADVMARAVAHVRDIRLTREYLAAHDGDAPALDAGISDNEQLRALAAELSRTDAARMLVRQGMGNGVPLCDTCGSKWDDEKRDMVEYGAMSVFVYIG